MSTAMQRLISESKHLDKKSTDSVQEPVEVKAKAPAQPVEPKAEPVVEAKPEDLEAEKQRSIESLDDEIKKLRQENAKRRLEAKTAEEIAAKLVEDKTKEFEARMQELADKAKRFDEIEKAKADQSKSTEEKLTARELELKELQESMQAERKAKAEAESKLKQIMEEKAREEEIRNQVIQARIDEIMKDIPEDKKKFATGLVNGASDKQDAYVTLLEAKQQGMFGAKKVEVAHFVPKNDSSPEKKSSDNLNYKQKMKNGLADIRKSGSVAPGAKLI